ncbi:Transcription factor MYB98 [Senna tora]|uniref:Transcription factor MYB98 n=1 Tax=Senna tora TaxID=362788 RepID=A0A834W6L2_9FABA|nr:Transcription factor MYB98 [Senna tora]
MVDMNNQSYVAYNSHQELTKPVDFVIADEVSCISPSSVDFYKRVGFNYKKNNRASSLSTRRTNLKVRKKSNMVKGQWTIEEDRVLIQLVEQYGLRKWSHIAQMLPGRIGKQCRERWHNHLKPDIKAEGDMDRRGGQNSDRSAWRSRKQMGRDSKEIGGKNRKLNKEPLECNKKKAIL